MADREKVIKEFELFIKDFHPACTSEGVELDMFREVLALLKEQEMEIRQLRLALDIAKGTCKGINVKGRINKHGKEYEDRIHL